MFEPAAVLLKSARASGPATNTTSVGAPDSEVVLKPPRITPVVPSASFSALGNTSIRASTVEPPLRVKRAEKSVGAA
jgi:hypothetical protein